MLLHIDRRQHTNIFLLLVLCHQRRCRGIDRHWGKLRVLDHCNLVMSCLFYLHWGQTDMELLLPIKPFKFQLLIFKYSFQNIHPYLFQNRWKFLFIHPLKLKFIFSQIWQPLVRIYWRKYTHKLLGKQVHVIFQIRMPKKYYKSKHKPSEMQESNLQYSTCWPRQNWKCNACGQIYYEQTPYCLSCYQELYYFSYINNQLFVIKDDSYIELYLKPASHYYGSEPTHELRLPQQEDQQMSPNEDQASLEEDSIIPESLNLDWIENLLN